MAVKYDAIVAERKRSAIIQERTFSIWALVRENRNSLNADLVCNRISEVIEMAVQDITAKTAELEKINEKLTNQLAETKRELKKVKESVQWNC